MQAFDRLRFTLEALRGYPLRSALILLAMSIAVMSILLLTALGEGARRYVINEFSSLGTNLLFVMPGRNETTGSTPPIVGETERDLTVDDALSLRRSHAITRIAPLIIGQAGVSAGALERDVNILGTSAEFMPLRNLKLRQGRFLPRNSIDTDSAVCVLGETVADELFPRGNAVGQWVRIAQRRFRVIGVLSKSGNSLFAPIADTALIPLASSMHLFNRSSLFRIIAQARSREVMDKAKQDIIKIISARHDGEEDITVIAQDAMISTFDRIFRVLNYAVAGIGAISLLVAGILIMNIMLVSVSQRTTEIGLLSALGASRSEIMKLFLTEASLLSIAGAATGLLSGLLLTQVALRFYPEFPVQVPFWAILAAIGVALLTGLIFGVHPARKAAMLDPVMALSGKRE